MLKVKIKLNITNNIQYQKAIKEKAFETATDVRLYNLPGVTALPDMAAATDVWLDNLPGVTALKEYLKRKGWRKI